MLDLQDTVLSGTRPEIDPRWPDTFVAVMQQCWVTDPPMRMSFAHALAALERV